MYIDAANWVAKYIDENLSDPYWSISEEKFKCQSYSKWILEEFKTRVLEETLKIPRYVMGQMDKDLFDILSELIYELFEFSQVPNESNVIFRAAKDTLMDLYYLEMEEHYDEFTI